MSDSRVAPAPVRFWRQVERTEGCWPWAGALDFLGYARFRVKSGEPKVMVHRYAYEQLVGPIPDGLELDHLCRTRYCVRPDHLEPVTHQENTRRSRWAQSSVCRRGHKFPPGEEYPRVCRPCANARNRAWKARKAAAR